MYTQTKPFVIANAGTTKYLCLSNVRKGYGIAAKHAYAYQDWQNNIQHPDQNFPAGCDVPVYFNWTGTVDGVTKNWGHIAVRLADGRVWTDGKYYANVDSLSRYYLNGSSYLGWGELVNSVRVVQATGGSMAETINDDVSRQIGWHFLGRNGFDGKPNALQAKQADIFGQPLTNAKVSEFFLSAEARDWRDTRIHKVYAERDALKGANANLTAERDRLATANGELTKTIANQAATITAQQSQINLQKVEIAELADENVKLKAQLASCGDSEDTDNLNKLGVLLRWLIQRLGVK